MVKNTKGGSSHKKLARKNEDQAKVVKIDVNVDFRYNLIVLIDKNIGNCFTARLIHFEPDKKDELVKYEGELKVLHQRARNARSIFKKTQSRLALVSTSDYKLPGAAIGYVEEFLEIEHLDEYLKHAKINQETYSKLNIYMTSNINELKDELEEGGFEFDRSNTDVDGKAVEKPVDEKEIDIDDI